METHNCHCGVQLTSQAKISENTLTIRNTAITEEYRREIIEKVKSAALNNGKKVQPIMLLQFQ